jgi:hypothetical protein
MTRSKEEDGKAWVVSTLRGLTESLQVPLESCQWPRSVEAGLTSPYPLVLGINGEERLLVLSSFDLSDCRNDPVVQTRVRRRLKGLLQSINGKTH